jgi:hypothetical protein
MEHLPFLLVAVVTEQMVFMVTLVVDQGLYVLEQ